MRERHTKSNISHMERPLHHQRVTRKRRCVMRHVCQCGQAIKLPEKPGRYTCPKCRKRLVIPPVAIAIVQNVPPPASKPTILQLIKEKPKAFAGVLAVVFLFVVVVVMALPKK